MMLAWWWVSFADGTLPKGSQFLGATVVCDYMKPDDPDGSFKRVLMTTHRPRINPGGSVRGVPAFGPLEVPEALREKLVTNRGELEAIMQAWTGKGVVLWT